MAGFGPRFDHLRHQRIGVRIGDLPRARLGPEVRELVAGREDRDPWAAKDAHLRVPERRQQSHFRGADTAARLNYDVAGADVLASRSDEGAGRYASGDRDPLAVAGDILLRYHRIGALGQGRARDYSHRLTRA